MRVLHVSALLILLVVCPVFVAMVVSLSDSCRAPFGIAEHQLSGISFSSTQCLYLGDTSQTGILTLTVQLCDNMQKALKQKSSSFVKTLLSGSIMMPTVSSSSAQ